MTNPAPRPSLADRSLRRLACGRPVLVVPAAVGPISFARAAIAWNGSREAVRAVHDALPLLALSLSVEIVTIISPEAVESSKDAKHLSAHLANHGIKIEPGVVQTRAEEEPIALRQQLEKADYDLSSWEATLTRSGWNSFSVERHNRFCCRRRYRSSFPTRTG
jgi:hypothetical protein